MPSPPGTPRTAGAERRLNSVTRPAAIAAREHSLAVHRLLEQRAAPRRGRARTRVTPGSCARPRPSRSPSTRTTSRRVPARWPVRRPGRPPTTPPVVDDRDRLAQVLDEVELVAGQQHAAPGPGLLHQYLADRVDACRVEAGERLVEHEQLRAVHQRGGQLNALLVAVRQRLHLAAGALGHSRAAPATSSLDSPASRPVMPVQPAEVLELLADLHPRIEPALFGHVAEPPPRRRAHRRPVPPHVPASRSTSPKIARIVVVLPAPFGPRKPTT